MFAAKITASAHEGSSRSSKMKNAIWAAALSAFMVAPLLYLDHRKDRGQFVTVNWLPGNIFVDALILLACAALLALILFLIMEKMPAFLEKHSSRNPIPRLRLSFKAKDIAVTAAIIFAIWIPVMIIMYPCASNHDFINQVYQYQSSAPTWYTTLRIPIDAEYIDHHPIFDTLVYGWFISIGEILGSQNIGMFLFSIVQNILVAITLSLSVCYMERLGLPKCLRLAALVFAIFFPYYPWFSSSAMKDMLFAIGFTPFCICFLEAFRTDGKTMQRISFLIAFSLVTGLCILTKKLGIYICLASFAVLFIAMKGFRLRVASIAVSSVLVFSMAFPALVYPALGSVAPGGRQESLCFAIQQTTALLKEKPKAVSKEDLAIIEKVLDTKAAKKDYKVALADGAKNHWRPEATSEDVRAYLAVWAKEGIRNPKIYLLSLAQCSGQLLIPSKQIVYPIDISDAYHKETWGDIFSTTGEGYNLQLERPESLVKTAKAIRSAFINGVGRIPLANLITTIGLYGGWIPLICVALTFKNNKKAAFALAPIMWSVCTLIISPGSLGRYVISIMFAMIVFASWMIYSYRLGDKSPNATQENPERAA